MVTSFYPCKVVLNTENAMEGDYVGVKIGNTDGLYIENMFIIKENGNSYVYMNDNGKIKKQQIQVGKIYDGYTTEVLDGINEEDYLAFPYGVTEGMDTEESTIDELYASY